MRSPAELLPVSWPDEELCCCALYQSVGVFKQAHMVVATSFREGGWVGRVSQGQDFTQSVLSGIEEASS